jgi:hypothetical protein
MQEGEKCLLKFWVDKLLIICLAKCKIEIRIFEIELILKKMPAERPKSRWFFDKN